MVSMENTENKEKMDNMNQRIQNTRFVSQNALFVNQMTENIPFYDVHHIYQMTQNTLIMIQNTRFVSQNALFVNQMTQNSLFYDVHDKIMSSCRM